MISLAQGIDVYLKTIRKVYFVQFYIMLKEFTIGFSS